MPSEYDHAALAGNARPPLAERNRSATHALTALDLDATGEAEWAATRRREARPT